MKNLLCETDEFNAKLSKVSKLIEEYQAVLKRLDTIGSSVNKDWSSNSGKSFYELFFKNKEELERLVNNYSAMNAFLQNVIKTYEKIENNYL